MIILVRIKRRVRYSNTTKMKQSSTDEWVVIDFRVIYSPLWIISETKVVDSRTIVSVR